MLINYFILIILPALSWAFSCHYNDSLIIARKTILVELSDRNYVHIYNATFDITLNNQSTSLVEFPKKHLQLIQDIQFRGHLVQNGISEYVETTLNSLVGYHYQKNGNVCRLRFQEAKTEGTNVTPDQETAILRLAQSCIQSRVCDIDLMKSDRDGDLYYQSIQSSINELVDFYVPKLLDSLLESDKSYRLSTINVATGDVSFYANDGLITGLDTIQRVNDVYIQHDNSKYIIDFKIRFSKLRVNLNKMAIAYKKFGVHGNSMVDIQGASLRANVIIDLQHQNCKVTLSNIGSLSFQHIKLDVPLWGFRLFTHTFNPQKLNKFEAVLLIYIFTRIPEFHFDCQTYMDQFSGVFQ